MYVLWDLIFLCFVLFCFNILSVYGHDYSLEGYILDFVDTDILH